MNKLRILQSTFRQSFKSMWRNRGMSLASISSISAVLVILGSILILIMSINSLVKEVQSRFDEVEVFMEEDISQEDRASIEEYLKSENSIKSVEYISEEEALEIYKESWDDDAYLLEGIEKLNDSYKVKVNDISDTDNIVQELKGRKGILRVKYHQEIIDKLTRTARYIRAGGIMVITVLIAISVFIISNTIKLTVASRKREINIMKYIGATNSYIKTPFVLEGILFGLVAAGISIIIVYFGYGYVVDLIKEKLYAVFSVVLVPANTILEDISIMFIAIGAGIGALGSMISMKKYLNV